MALDLDLQLGAEFSGLPTKTQLADWVSAALRHAGATQQNIEMTIRIVDRAESEQLNATYRGKHKPTNVLSFPFEAPPEIPCDLLGDLVICAPIVELEASEQNKLVEDHWAHMTIHGSLHLLGFDHIQEAEADEMESLEKEILAEFNIANPYSQTI